MKLISRVHNMSLKERLYFFVMHLTGALDTAIYLGTLGFFTGNFQANLIFHGKFFTFTFHE